MDKSWLSGWFWFMNEWWVDVWMDMWLNEWGDTWIDELLNVWWMDLSFISQSKVRDIASYIGEMAENLAFVVYSWQYVGKHSMPILTWDNEFLKLFWSSETLMTFNAKCRERPLPYHLGEACKTKIENPHIIHQLFFPFRWHMLSFCLKGGGGLIPFQTDISSLNWVILLLLSFAVLPIQ